MTLFFHFFLYKVTCHLSFIDLHAFQAVELNVLVSGELTTSRGLGTTFQFALSFVEQLFGLRVAEDIEKILVCQKNLNTFVIHIIDIGGCLVLDTNF